jgi:hypothetical protein
MLENEDCTAPIDPSTPPSQRPFPWAEHGTRTILEFYPLQPTALNPAVATRHAPFRPLFQLDSRSRPVLPGLSEAKCP